MKGFTLIEILVVMSITVVMTGVLITNFSRTRVDLTQSRILVQDAIREAQSLALSGALFNGKYRCGYGIHFEADSYRIYAAPASEDIDCTTLDRTYDSGEDETVRVGLISNSTVHILPAPDIFFEPPKPTTYIDDDPDHADIQVILVRGTASCANLAVSNDVCRIIDVTTSGLITTK